MTVECKIRLREASASNDSIMARQNVRVNNRKCQFLLVESRKQLILDLDFLVGNKIKLDIQERMF